MKSTQRQYETTRIWSETLAILREIATRTNRSIVAVIHVLATNELKRLNKRVEKGRE